MRYSQHIVDRFPTDNPKIFIHLTQDFADGIVNPFASAWVQGRHFTNTIGIEASNCSAEPLHFNLLKFNFFKVGFREFLFLFYPEFEFKLLMFLFHRIPNARGTLLDTVEASFY